MPPIYTHDLKLNIGSESVLGEIEFNVDGEASYTYNSDFANLTLDQSRALTEFYTACRNIFLKFGSIEDVEINEKA